MITSYELDNNELWVDTIKGSSFRVSCLNKEFFLTTEEAEQKLREL